MNRQFYSRAVALLILLGFPLGFFFYYKQKIDALPHQAKTVQTFWNTPYFKYQTQNGDSLSADDLKGFIYVADFIYTNCGSMCPNLSKTMSDIETNFTDNQKLKLVSFSVDPERDSVPALKQYAARFGARDGKWYFLRGQKDSVLRMAEEGFKLPVVANDHPMAGDEFAHSERIVLVDANGMIRGFYNGFEKDRVDSLNNNIAKLLVELQGTLPL